MTSPTPSASNRNPGAASSVSPGDWTLSPGERGRFLDGEGSAAERTERIADLARDPAAAERVEAERVFLEAVRRAGSARPAPSQLLEPRVRRALLEDRAAGFPSAAPPTGLHAPRVRRRLAAIAAGVLVAVTGTALWATSERVPSAISAVRLAARTYERAAREGAAMRGDVPGSCDEGAASPHRFPPVRSGELSIASCSNDGADSDPRSVSVLRGTDTKDPRGLVVVPTDGKSTSTDVGWTRVDDVVVFDVTIGGAKYYLATRWSSVEGTETCAACHGPTRASNPSRNPHMFFERVATPK
jgi:hypothetical protein